MKDLNIIAGKAENYFLRREMIMKGQFTKESNTLAFIANIWQLQREVLMNIKGEIINDSRHPR